MDGSRRTSSWLRLACALVLSLGLSSAAATTAAAQGLTPRDVAAVTHAQAATTLSVVQSAAIRSGIELRHTVTKHRPPATASALVVAAIVLTGLAAATVRRRRTEPDLSHLALSHGARAPPVVIGF